MLRAQPRPLQQLDLQWAWEPLGTSILHLSGIFCHPGGLGTQRRGPGCLVPSSVSHRGERSCVQGSSCCRACWCARQGTVPGLGLQGLSEGWHCSPDLRVSGPWAELCSRRGCVGGSPDNGESRAFCQPWALTRSAPWASVYSLEKQKISNL